MLLTCAAHAVAAGTGAGTLITNTAQMTFDVSGSPQPVVTSAAVVTRVDELLDAAVAPLQATPVIVTSPQTQAVTSYSVHNTGNGGEAYRLSTVVQPAAGGFQPAVTALYLETNGVAGLQTGAGGDELYSEGLNDPLLPAEDTLTVHVTVSVPAGVAAASQGSVALSAVPVTVVAQTGATAPADVGFPTPGQTFAGAGDGSSDAVVGLSHAASPTALTAESAFQIGGPQVQLTKSVVRVTDPDGGTRVLPGAEVAYELVVSVNGTGVVSDMVVADVVPVDLAYVPGTLALDGVSVDDDFAPAGTDESGYDSAGAQVSVALGAVTAGSAPRRVTFLTTVR